MPRKLVPVKTYHAEVDQDGDVWRIRVPEVARTTQARTLDEVEPMARDLIAIMDGIPADSFSLDVTRDPMTPGPAAAGYREPVLSRKTRALWRDEEPERPLWEMFPPKADRCPVCRYRLDAPGHKNSMH